MVANSTAQSGRLQQTSDAFRALPRRLQRGTFRIARVIVYVVVVTAILGFFAVRTVRAQIAERTLSIGRNLSQFRDLLRGAHRIEINGEPLYVASAVTRQSMSEVLDRFEKECRSHTGGVAEELDQLPEASREIVRAHAPAAWSNRFGVWREDREKEASIVCLERREGHGMADSAHALTKFLATGDVYAIGNLRYVYVRPTDDGATHVLSTFTEGPFNLFNVVGQGKGEPTGQDPAFTPRVPDGKRMLSAELDSHMYGTYLFSSAMSAEDALRFYKERLPGNGWRLLFESSFAGTHVWQHDGVTMVVSAIPGEESQTNLTFSQARTVAERGAP